MLRSATQPLTTREITEQLLVVRDQTSIAEQLLKTKRAGAANAGTRDALHKTVLAALNSSRNKGLIERTGSSRGTAASWRIVR